MVGWPVAHSRSPAMMAAALAALGLDWRYLRLPVAPAAFAATVGALPASGYRGVNVTIPHKREALAVATSATDTARAIGAANTLTFSGGETHADNTDAGGLLAALPSPVAGARALVLGAGGAGRAAAYALREAGAGEVLVWNRTPQRARELAAELGVGVAGRPEPTDLVVNTTSVGLDLATSERVALESLGLDSMHPPPVVVDLVYGARETPVAAWGRRGGARVVEGLEVLVRQGALSLERWTGEPAPLDTMRRAARGVQVAEADGAWEGSLGAG